MLAGLVIVVMTAVASGCSIPSTFPAILDNPTPRGDTPMTPDQVKQATDDLVSARKRLCAEATANTSAGAAPVHCAPEDAVVTGTTKTAGAAAKP